MIVLSKVNPKTQKCERFSKKLWKLWTFSNKPTDIVLEFLFFKFSLQCTINILRLVATLLMNVFIFHDVNDVTNELLLDYDNHFNYYPFCRVKSIPSMSATNHNRWLLLPTHSFMASTPSLLFAICDFFCLVKIHFRRVIKMAKKERQWNFLWKWSEQQQQTLLWVRLIPSS